MESIFNLFFNACLHAKSCSIYDGKPFTEITYSTDEKPVLMYQDFAQYKEELYFVDVLKYIKSSTFDSVFIINFCNYTFCNTDDYAMNCHVKQMQCNTYTELFEMICEMTAPWYRDTIINRINTYCKKNKI